MSEVNHPMSRRDVVEHVALTVLGRTPIDVGEGVMLTSLDLASAPARAELRRVLNGASEVGGESVGSVVQVRDWLLQSAESVDPESGEVSPYVRGYLLLADGRCLRFGSAGIARSIRLYDALERRAPWDPPWSVRIAQRQIQGGHRWYYLDDADAAPSLAKVGNKGGGK